ncbi:hypothetical protein AMECASPLE_036891 [Ameca splendens]|uniref:Uncharacterized protein n=1 Tax=Ameca splendens TaxID=208324 RepID=A0ABV0Z6X9_9TELE
MPSVEEKVSVLQHFSFAQRNSSCSFIFSVPLLASSLTSFSFGVFKLFCEASGVCQRTLKNKQSQGRIKKTKVHCRQVMDSVVENLMQSQVRKEYPKLEHLP